MVWCTLEMFVCVGTFMAPGRSRPVGDGPAWPSPQAPSSLSLCGPLCGNLPVLTVRRASRPRSLDFHCALNVSGDPHSEKYPETITSVTDRDACPLRGCLPLDYGFKNYRGWSYLQVFLEDNRQHYTWHIECILGACCRTLSITSLLSWHLTAFL